MCDWKWHTFDMHDKSSWPLDEDLILRLKDGYAFGCFYDETDEGGDFGCRPCDGGEWGIELEEITGWVSFPPSEPAVSGWVKFKQFDLSTWPSPGVLVQVYDGRMGHGRRVMSNVSFSKPKWEIRGIHPNYDIDGNHYHSDFIEKKITHWMPCADPPEKKDE